MKLTKKLLPALGMLALSTCMMVTSTFAWFSMNTNVKASNMIVQAKGDQVYLQIVNPDADTAEGRDAEFVNGKAQTSAIAETDMAKLLPVNVVKAVTGEGTTSTTTAYDGGATYKWVTNYLQTNLDGTTSLTGYEEVASGDLGLYVLANTFKIRLDPTAGATEAKNALSISSITAEITGIAGTVAADDQAFKKCLSVFVLSKVTTTTPGVGDAPATTETATFGTVWENTAGTGTLAKKSGKNALSPNSNFLNTQVAEVEIYVFFNGDNANCTQEMLAKIKDATYNVTVNFTVATTVTDA